MLASPLENAASGNLWIRQELFIYSADQIQVGSDARILSSEARAGEGGGVCVDRMLKR